MNEEQKIENLLKPRYLVVADYPMSKFTVGDILHKYVFETSVSVMYTYVTNPESPLQGAISKPEYVESMPHIFRPLSWWEKREEKDMPGYVKEEGGRIYLSKWKIKEALKIILYDTPNDLQCGEYFVTKKVMCFFEPVTEQDYLTYTNKQL